jgi:hypothetical protein
MQREMILFSKKSCTFAQKVIKKWTDVNLFEQELQELQD